MVVFTICRTHVLLCLFSLFCLLLDTGAGGGYIMYHIISVPIGEAWILYIVCCAGADVISVLPVVTSQLVS